MIINMNSKFDLGDLIRFRDKGSDSVGIVVSIAANYPQEIFDYDVMFHDELSRKNYTQLFNEDELSGDLEDIKKFAVKHNINLEKLRNAANKYINFFMQ